MAAHVMGRMLATQASLQDRIQDMQPCQQSQRPVQCAPLGRRVGGDYQKIYQ